MEQITFSTHAAVAGLMYVKLWKFEYHMTCQFAIFISETISDRAKPSKLSTLSGLLSIELQILKMTLNTLIGLKLANISDTVRDWAKLTKFWKERY